jgi:hypothetical protein
MHVYLRPDLSDARAFYSIILGCINALQLYHQLQDLWTLGHDCEHAAYTQALQLPHS